MAREVICVDTDSNGPDDCRCITHLGYEYEHIDSSGRRTREQVHDDIKDGKTYYVKHNGEKSELEERTRNGTKYVRTAPTDTTEDNLLKQPSCN